MVCSVSVEPPASIFRVPNTRVDIMADALEIAEIWPCKHFCMQIVAIHMEKEIRLPESVYWTHELAEYCKNRSHTVQQT